MSRHHVIEPTPETLVWGYFDATSRPVLRVASGDTVTLTTPPAGGVEGLPPDPDLVPDWHRRCLEETERAMGSHFMAGPVFVEGAAPGDVLQIDILEHRFPCTWGYVAIRPERGTLPKEFTEYTTIHPRIDAGRGVCVLRLL